MAGNPHRKARILLQKLPQIHAYLVSNILLPQAIALRPGVNALGVVALINENPNRHGKTSYFMLFHSIRQTSGLCLGLILNASIFKQIK